MAATLEAGRDHIISGVPLHRIGEPDDVAGACIFLSSKAGSYVNGCVAASFSQELVDVMGGLMSLWMGDRATIALDGGSLVAGKL